MPIRPWQKKLMMPLRRYRKQSALYAMPGRNKLRCGGTGDFSQRRLVGKARATGPRQNASDVVALIFVETAQRMWDPKSRSPE